MPEYPLNFSPGVRWFSEALLPSAFLAQYKGDRLAEAWTHLDGVIGHLTIGNKGKADIALLPDATHFVALEAKMFSGLSSQVKNIRYYDQAARNVACIAEVLRRAARSPEQIAQLGFYVIAPHSQIRRGIFTEAMSQDSIRQKVEQRVQEYGKSKAEWYAQWFQPTFEQMKIGVLSWDEIIAIIEKDDTLNGKAIREFYERCIEFNSK